MVDLLVYHIVYHLIAESRHSPTIRSFLSSCFFGIHSVSSLPHSFHPTRTRINATFARRRHSPSLPRSRPALAATAPGDRRAERHHLLLHPRTLHPQRHQGHGDGLLVHQPVHRLRLRMRVLLRTLRASLRHGARFRRRSPRSTAPPRRSSAFRRGSPSSDTSSSSATPARSSRARSATAATSISRCSRAKRS